jgi:hypothetical protein
LFCLYNVTGIHSLFISLQNMDHRIEMEYDIPYKLIVTIVLIAVVLFFMVDFFMTTPRYPRMEEAFVPTVLPPTPIVLPESLRTHSEAHALFQLLGRAQAAETVDTAMADERELILLTEKLVALQQDLTSTEHTPHATHPLPFETAHDRIPVADLAGMCLAKSTSPRDLEIVFTTWRERGQALIRRLCTARHLVESDCVAVERLFSTMFDTTKDTAQSVCIGRAPSLTSPGDSAPYEPEQLRTRRSYDVTYGGLSASGWNSI